jgi:asparagine synthetase B (glutamine-hydrolysing)
MVDQLVPSVQEEIRRNAQRGLWFAVFDPAGLRRGRAPSSGPATVPVRGDATAHLGVATVGEADQLHPTWSASRTVEVIFAGTLFDRVALTSGRGRAPRRASDSSLVLRAYEERGPDVLGDLRGVFAAILYDADRDLLLAARDHLGISPLFTSEVDSSLVLSATVDGLLEHPAVQPALNRALLVDHVRHRYLDPGETHFEAVRRIPPGHALRIERGRSTVTRFWDPAPPGADVDWLTEAEAEGFADVLDRAVDRCLQMGAGGIYLSGGLDSVSVAAMASDVSRRLDLPTPVALSLGFPHPQANEEDVQRRVAGQLGLPQVLLPLEEAVPEGLLRTALDMCGHWPAPLLNFWLPGYCRLAVEGRQRGCRIILTGGGGDEWLSVGPYYAADSLRRLDVTGLRLVWGVWKRSYPLSTRQLLRSLWLFGVRPPLESSAQRALRATAPGAIKAWRRRRLERAWPGWLAPDPDLRRLIFAREAARPSELQPGKDRFAFYLWDGRKSLDHALVSLEMEEDFEVARRLGLLEVHPYWDPDVVEFLFRTPPELLLRGGRGKGLVRNMLAERFPGLGFESQKKVVSTGYFRETMLQEAALAWKETGGVRALDDLGVVDGPSFGGAVDSILAGRDLRTTYRIWDVLSLEVWARARL